MANNKVQLADGTVLIDLTGDNVQPKNVEEGVTFHDASGTQRSGTLQRGAQVASGSFIASNTYSMTITPGFIVKNICFAVAYNTSTGAKRRGGGMYIDGVKSGDIESITSNASQTIVTFSKEFGTTIFWLATS